MDILIHTPLRTETEYEIWVSLTPQNGPPQAKRLGLTAANFTIPHLDLWDSFLPLMWITRNGGPLFNKAESRAMVRAEYPLHSNVVEFFSARARKFGLEIDVVSTTYERTYDVTTSGTAVLFGGGKDSRLLLGTLQELGERPTAICAKGRKYAQDIEGARVFETFNFEMANRIVPALMLAPRTIYHGSGLGEAHKVSPWHQYYDISAPEPVAETSALLGRLGFDICIHVPQCVLPFNLVQAILARRYPDLYAGQVSVEPHDFTDKNLHVSLLERYHGLSHAYHCSEQLLVRMAETFIRRSVKEPDQFGYQRSREVFEREMRAILLTLVQDGRLVLPREAPAVTWKAEWIDKIHAYVNPAADPRLFAIYREYADVWDGPAEMLPEPLRSYL